MKVYVPTNKDFLEIGGHAIQIERLRTMHIDFDRGIINYELWVETKEIQKLPGPQGYSSVMYTGRHEINEDAKLVLLSMMDKLKDHRVSCFVQDSTYESRKHRYLVRFTVHYKRDKMAENFHGFAPENKALYLDLD